LLFITGASSRGIGGAVVEQFAREGATIAIASQSEPTRLLNRLEKLSAPAIFRNCDVTRGAEVRRAIEAAVDEFGKIDVVVNNAGVELAGSLDRMTDDDWQQLLLVNLHGSIAVSRAALPNLVEPGGVIVNVASALGLGGCSGFSAYSASKAGLVGFTQSLAWEVASRGIRVVAVAPGLVLTPMVLKHGQHLTEQAWKELQAAHPLGVGRPADVSAAIAFLASEEARWITGVTLPLGWAPHYPLPTQPFMSR
jgi:NAD(P)-dependent dehydrogenase (short-subunit alcohol dehydrogenase family)